jgi:hypothetical protein
MNVVSRYLTDFQWRNIMSHTVHVAKVPHKQAAIDRKAAEHHDQIADAAYFHAEHRGFKGGDPVSDWLAAEAEIDAAQFNKGGDISAH